MKLYLSVFAFFSLLVVLVCAFVPSSFAAAFESEAYVSAGIVSESRFPEIGFSERDFFTSAEESEPSVEGESEGTRFGEDAALSAAGEKETLFTCGGTYTCDLTKGAPFLLGTVLAERTGLDLPTEYKAFASADKMSPLTSPLDAEEVSYLFASIVETATVNLPVRCALAEISYSVSETRLVASALIEVSFSDLAKRYHLAWLPTAATFRITAPFELKDSEISVVSGGIELTSASFRISEKLILFGCNLVFGRRDYVTLLSSAVKNVFVNAGIYK